MCFHARDLAGLVAAVAALAAVARAGTAAEPAAEAYAAAIREAIASYVEAVNQGDLKAVAELWSEEGDFVDATGRRVKGQTLAEAEIAQHQRGSVLTVEIDAIRRLTPNVAIAEGTARRSPASDDRPLESQDRPPESQNRPTRSRFTTVWVRQEGRWLIDAVRESAIEAPSHHDFLTEIEWMIGDWISHDERPVRMSCAWSDDKNFILREVHAKNGDEELTISQRIGWDPLTERIKSWAFDSRGGYVEGLWARDGDSWIVESKGVLPGGLRAAGAHVYTLVDERTFTWESIDGRIGDAQVPDTTREFVRQPAQEGP